MIQTGHGRIDAEHQEIISAMERIRLALEAGDAAIDLLSQAIATCVQHWQHEAALLERTNWPQAVIAFHLRDHTRLERRLGQMLRDQFVVSATVPADVTACIDAIYEHIVDFDLSLCTCLVEGSLPEAQRT